MESIIAWILVTVFLVLTFLPLVRSDFWTFRILEYPRLQKLVIGILLLGCVLVFEKGLGASFWWLAAILVLCCIYQVVKIFPYTIMARKEMKLLKAGVRSQEVVIFTANVLQDNRNYDVLLRQIKSSGADIIFLVETDQAWEKALSGLESAYPHTIKCPLDNTYGLLFYSRLPLREPEVLFRTERDVPSIKAEFLLPSGKWVRLYGLHPKPPVPHESLSSTAKDKELMKVAFEVENEKDPCIVMGDLNDVAWSHVTELFRKVSGLLDPRRGRGFYSTFSADHWWMRFPLDYIFCSAHFGLIRMKRLPYNGSDHFAMVTHLRYEPSLRKVHEEPQADAEEEQEAMEKANS